MAGQGTIGLEISSQVPKVEAIVVPVGGGGLVGGVAVAVKALRPGCAIIGVQTEALPAMREALRAGQPVTVPSAITIADGIAVRRTGTRTLALAQRLVDDVVLVSEEEIANAILLLLEIEKTVAEGAGAAPLAALVNKRIDLRGRRVVLLVSGGNIDVNLLSRITGGSRASPSCSATGPAPWPP
jgi:threonine dehydratase